MVATLLEAEDLGKPVHLSTFAHPPLRLDIRMVALSIPGIRKLLVHGMHLGVLPE